MKNTSKIQTDQSITYSPKPLEELDMMDAFLFEAATENAENAKKIARIIIERVTGRQVKNLVIETQKQLKGINVDKRGIRMDLYTMEKDFQEEQTLNRCRTSLPSGYCPMIRLEMTECSIR